MDIKIEFVKEYLDTFNIPTFSKVGKSYVDAVVLGYREASMSAAGYDKWVKKYFPDKPKNTKIFNYILSTLDLKFCGGCNSILDTDLFYQNKSNLDGLNSQCRSCHSKSSALTQPHRSAEYRARVEQAVPKWADLAVIAEFYKNCPEGYHVDHIIPLKGENVSGLHVIENLQYLPAIENIKKSNKF